MTNDNATSMTATEIALRSAQQTTIGLARTIRRRAGDDDELHDLLDAIEDERQAVSEHLLAVQGSLMGPIMKAIGQQAGKPRTPKLSR